MEVEAFQGQQREEQQRLVATEETGQATAGAGLLGGPHQDVRGDIGVQFLMIGIGVVAGVLVHPPAVAHAYAEVAEQPSPDLAVPAPPEDLPVGQVVRHQGDLPEHHGQKCGHGQLPPGVAEREEGSPARSEQPDHETEPYRVVTGAPLQQTGFAHALGQPCEIAAGTGVGRARTRVGGPGRHGGIRGSRHAENSGDGRPPRRSLPATLWIRGLPHVASGGFPPGARVTWHLVLRAADHRPRTRASTWSDVRIIPLRCIL